MHRIAALGKVHLDIIKAIKLNLKFIGANRCLDVDGRHILGGFCDVQFLGDQVTDLGDTDITDDECDIQIIFGFDIERLKIVA